MYDNRAVVRVIATPKDAAVYVDGFYAGTVHDFNDSSEMSLRDGETTPLNVSLMRERP